MLEGNFRQRERAMQKASRPGRIKDQLRVNLQRLSAMAALDDGPPLLHLRAPQVRLVEIRHAELLRLGHEEGIEVRAVPVGIGDAIIGRSGDEQLLAVCVVIAEFAARLVMEEREAAFQSAGDFGMRGLPRSPFRERANRREIVAVAKFFEDQVRERRG